ncbi:BQ2448_2613 [Microbotryum intermedium]|uniref:BQ2448_2613 protein n=1 Tax=Microbotryum intermedium TaxID=269621 RepID=A0A238FC68_9BASI|nr:BQ2448_2613 [Microbotryum intermedium]
MCPGNQLFTHPDFPDNSLAFKESKVTQRRSRGCSSSTALFFALGPCLVADGGKNTVRNPYSWNEKVNNIFLDSLIKVGTPNDIVTFAYPSS